MCGPVLRESALPPQGGCLVPDGTETTEASGGLCLAHVSRQDTGRLGLEPGCEFGLPVTCPSPQVLSGPIAGSRMSHLEPH